MPSQIPSALGPVERAQAGSLCAAIYTLRAASPKLSSEELVVLLTIALHPGMPQVKVAEGLDLTNGTKMRIFNNLSEQGEGGKAGLNLIRSYLNPSDRREKLWELTHAGSVLVRAALREAFKGEGEHDGS